jgi:L-aminopeptidase/D-esterase-like protein
VIWEVPGITVGHATLGGARTGCTVVLATPAAVASGEVRGSAPATREMALLEPTAAVERVDAVVLSGGSAFGLAAASGVVDWLAEHGRGFPTRFGPVPIVVGLSLYDLGVGDPAARPGPAEGRSAVERAARRPGRDLGAVGAGAGATVGKWRGAAAAVDGGLAGAVRRQGDLVVAALVAVNAWGDVVGYGHHGEPDPPIPLPDPLDAGGGALFGNTTIGVVATNAALDKVGCLHVARGAHDGLARAVSPPHASADGDAFVALATGEVEAPVDLVRWMAVEVAAEAIAGLGVTVRARR